MIEKLADIPTLDSLMADPGLVQTLPAHVVEHILIQVISLLPLLVAKAHAVPTTQAPGPPERFLTVDEAVAQFGLTKTWLYRHKTQLPYSQPSRKVLLFPEEKLRRWFASRKVS